MSDFNTNLTDRSPPRLAPDIVEIFLESDFPAPASGIIALAADTTYRICGSITTANQLSFPTASDCEIQGGFLGAELVYTGTAAFIITDSFADGGIYRVNGMRFELTGANATVFNIDTENTGTVLIKDTVFIFTGDPSGLGLFTSIVLDLENIFMFNPSLPSVFAEAAAIMELVTAITPTASDMGEGSLFEFTGAGGSVSCRGISTSLVDDDHIFDFDAVMGGPILIDDCADIDPSNVAMFDTVADVDVVSFADNGGLVRVDTTGDPHGYTTGDYVLIDGSANYHGGYQITVIDTVTFDLDGSIFDTNDAIDGSTTANNGSLDYSDTRVTVANSGGYQSSRTIGSIVATSNTDPTAITQNTFAQISLDSLAVPGPQNEGFALSDADSGAMVYIGEEPVNCHVTCDLVAEIGTGSDVCSMRLRLNNGALPPNANLSWTQSIQAAQQQQWHGTWLVELDTDDELWVEITNQDTSEDITVAQYTLTCN